VQRALLEWICFTPFWRSLSSFHDTGTPGENRGRKKATGPRLLRDAARYSRRTPRRYKTAEPPKGAVFCRMRLWNGKVVAFTDYVDTHEVAKG
jgi:hypothetical protein